MQEEKSIHLIVALLSLVFCSLIIIPYWLKRNHYLISYNGYKLNLTIGIMASTTMVGNAVHI